MTAPSSASLSITMARADALAHWDTPPAWFGFLRANDLDPRALEPFAGTIGVAPDSTRKVSSAEIKASATTIPPTQPDTRRDFSSPRGIILASLTDADTFSDNSEMAGIANRSRLRGATDAPPQRCCQNMTFTRR